MPNAEEVRVELKKDVERLHGRISDTNHELSAVKDGAVKAINDLTVSLMKLTTTVEMMPKSHLPGECDDFKEHLRNHNEGKFASHKEGECKELVGHLNEHKETKTLWKAPIVSSIVHILEIALVFLVGYWLAGGK